MDTATPTNSNPQAPKTDESSVRALVLNELICGKDEKQWQESVIINADIGLKHGIFVGFLECGKVRDKYFVCLKSRKKQKPVMMLKRRGDERTDRTDLLFFFFFNC